VWVQWSVASVTFDFCDVYVCVRALNEKRLELLTPNFVHGSYSKAGRRHALTLRSKGQTVEVTWCMRRGCMHVGMTV